MSMATTQLATVRQIIPHWNAGLIVVSIGVSFLGAFTSTQLICQARAARYLSGVLIWLILSSLVFGFTGIWCLHFVSMIACELDLPIGLNPFLTALSAALAVFFTFFALGSDLLMERYKRQKRKRAAAFRRDIRRKPSAASLPESWMNGGPQQQLMSEHNQMPLNDERPPVVRQPSTQSSRSGRSRAGQRRTPSSKKLDQSQFKMSRPEYRHDPYIANVVDPLSIPLLVDERPLQLPDVDDTVSSQDGTDNEDRYSSDYTESRRSSTVTESDASAFGLGNFASVRTIKKNAFGTRNPFRVTALVLWTGLTVGNIAKGFVWSLAITGMHYTGILSLRIPHGRVVLDPYLVVVSAVISWVVCTVGSILMASMEIHIGQQLLFSVIATTGVAAMHFSGMRATSFFSTEAPSDISGYPTSLPIAIGSIAILTCFAANGLLAQSATVARNKLAEIVQTRKKLWSAIAQKENAEAAAIARSEFIASASHEIRTPLHQLQGYSDLLSRTNLSQESRLLLYAIQDATRSLSLITNNVLDWSRLEKGEAVCRPTALDMRKTIDSIINLLPTKDEEADVELLISVAPDIPSKIFIDPSYFTRVCMNLVSNSLKFTCTGYVLLSVSLDEGNLKVAVSDTGPGIPESFLPQLFEPFKQAQTRGAHRGTGLGLSIVRQLLEKMRGSIETDSKHQDTPGVGAERSGTVFTATIPVHRASETEPPCSHLRKKVALFGDCSTRTVQGIVKAWELYHVEVKRFEHMSEDVTGEYMIWADAAYLTANPTLVQELAQQEQCPVIIPYEEERQLRRLLRVANSTFFVPIHKPLVWHHIVEKLVSAGQKRPRPDLPSRTVRFSSVVDVHQDAVSDDKRPEIAVTEPLSPNEPTTPPAQPPTPEPTSRAPTLLLVEDNKINQRLGARMLKTLGYDVILANDGQEAVDLIVANDEIIDAVLMDQNMPVKDGLTATREIREMEGNGKLHGRERRPIIAVTAVVGPQAEAMCREAGTDAFLPKPLSLTKLRETLDMFGITADG